ncbi:sodium/solute symporter [Verrucomicrobiota bacterium]
MSINLSPLDITILVAYFAAIVGVGLWAGLKKKESTGSDSYFRAGGTLTWWVIGLALFSTNISTIHLVGFAQEGYVNGLAHGNFEWMAPFTLIALSLFFAPFYLKSRIATLPDFLEKRYSRSCRDWLAFLSILSAVMIHIVFCLYTGAVVLKGLFGIPINVSIILAAVVTGIYTVIGGLLAVVITGAMQSVILLVGSIIITIIAMNQVGGWSGLVANVEPVKLTVLRSASDPCNLPWYSVFLGYPVIGLWYWCADQTIVQRVLGAKDENHARVGPLFCGFLKILPVFIFFLPGTAYYALVKMGKFAPLLDTKDCYARAIMDLLPAGLRGLMAAALLAALMSTVAGALNSIGTLFSYDLWKRWKPDTPDKKLVLIGKIATFAGMVIAILCARMVERFETIYQGANAVICYLAPPITVVFLFGVLWKKASTKGALYTLGLGSLLGGVVFCLDFFSKNYCEWFNATAPALANFEFLFKEGKWNVPFMMAAFYLFCIDAGIMIAFSIAKPHQHTEESSKLVWNNPIDALRGNAWKGIGNYKFLSAALFVTMVVLYIIFR